jgi:hypothetical protein
MFGTILSSVLGMSGLDGIVKSITEVVGKFIPDPTVKAQLEAEVRKIVAEGQKAQYDAMSTIMAADASSDSAFTRNARPVVVYWSLAVISSIVGASLFGVADPMIAALSQVPDKLYEMVAMGVGIFTAGRSAEKVATTVSKAIILRKK